MAKDTTAEALIQTAKYEWEYCVIHKGKPVWTTAGVLMTPAIARDRFGENPRITEYRKVPESSSVETDQQLLEEIMLEESNDTLVESDEKNESLEISLDVSDDSDTSSMTIIADGNIVDDSIIPVEEPEEVITIVDTPPPPPSKSVKKTRKKKQKNTKVGDTPSDKSLETDEHQESD